MFLSFRESVADALGAALRSRGLPTDDLGIEEPPEDVDAVLASSVAFRLAGEVGAPPPAPSGPSDPTREVPVHTVGHRYVNR